MTEKQKEILKKASEDEMYGALLGYARRLVRNYSLAEEFTQEAFLRLAEERENHKKVVNEQAWLYRTVRNMIFDFLRRQKKQNEIFNHLTATASDSIPEQAVASAEKKEAEEMLIEKLDQLPERQREALRLKFQEKLTYDEMAVVMGESRSAVSRLVADAVQKLREMMKV